MTAPAAKKSVDGFGDIRGLCPEEPTKQGSYYSAAVAYYGRTQDMHATADGDQNVYTYAVGLASPLPRIEIPLMGKTVTMVPFAKSVGGFGISSAQGDFQPTNTIVDFFVETITPHLRQLPDQLRRRGAGRRPRHGRHRALRVPAGRR